MTKDPSKMTASEEAYTPLTFAAREPLPLGCWDLITMRILYMGHFLDGRAIYARRIRECIREIIDSGHGHRSDQFTDAEGFNAGYPLPMAYKHGVVLPIIEETIAEWKALMAAGGSGTGRDERNLQSMFDRNVDC